MSEKPRVKLRNEDGNAYAIMARVRRALIENDQADKVADFLKEATSSDYDHLLQTCFKYADIE